MPLEAKRLEALSSGGGGCQLFVDHVAVLLIQCAWRRKKAYIIVKRKRRLRDGATAMQKVFRMYKVRE